MAGFFDLSDPDNAAMLGLASGLLQAGMPQRLPVPTGAAFGSGLAAALNAGLAAQRLQDARGLHKPAAQQPDIPQPASQSTVLQQLAAASAPSYMPMLPPRWLLAGPRYRNL